MISLQRCFRLGPVSAGNLLAAAATEGSQLQAVLLSHLDGIDLPKEPVLLGPSVFHNGNSKEIERMEIGKSVGSSESGGAGLRILALHNCGSIGSSQLAAIVSKIDHSHLLRLWFSVRQKGKWTKGKRETKSL